MKGYELWVSVKASAWFGVVLTWTQKSHPKFKQNMVNATETAQVLPPAVCNHRVPSQKNLGSQTRVYIPGSHHVYTHISPPRNLAAVTKPFDKKTRAHMKASLGGP